MEDSAKQQVIAGIVFYNSDYKRLIKNVKNLEKQVAQIILFDNSPKEMATEKKEWLKQFKCRYIFSGHNVGFFGEENAEQ